MANSTTSIVTDGSSLIYWSEVIESQQTRPLPVHGFAILGAWANLSRIGNLENLGQSPEISGT